MAAKVTILDSIPIGRRAIVTVDGEPWMAFPLAKIARLHVHAGRHHAIAASTQRQLMSVLADRPDLYPLLRPALATLDRAEHVPAWCHDRPETKATRTVNWRKPIRDWARNHEADRATIRHCGPVKELTIDSLITRIRKTRGTLTPLQVTTTDSPPSLTLAYPDGRIAARIDTPMP